MRLIILEIKINSIICDFRSIFDIEDQLVEDETCKIRHLIRLDSIIDIL